MIRWMMALVLLVAAPATVRAQDDSLASAATAARRAWSAQDPVALLAESPRVVVQLPGADPAPALGRDQAAALLRDFFGRGQEVEVTLRSVREVEAGRGYVELDRRYRVAGTQEVRDQSLLLGYRRGRQGWVLSEIRVVE
ncbi:MAG: hypothetical protein M3Y31_07130 [Gemmatimonadota bacterium]|nr:hypothetical protein [Gemmatimonadota bacterium]